MNPLGFLTVFALLSTIVKADHVLVVGNQDSLVHEAVDVNAAQFSRAGLAELALDAFGIATGNVVSLSNSVEFPAPKVRSPVQADVFEHVDAYTVIFVDNVDVVESVNKDIKTGYHKVFELEKGTSPVKLSAVLAQELKGATPNGEATIKCVGNSALCQSTLLPTEAVDTTELDNVFAENSFLNRQNDADNAFAREVALAYQLTKSMAKTKAKGLYIIQYSSLQALDEEKRKSARVVVINQVQKVLSSLQKAYPLSGAQVIATESAPLTHIDDVESYGRMLLSLSNVSGASNNATRGINGTAQGNVTLSMEEIAEYQIVLWTSVILGSILLVVLMAMCNMAPPRDSLLYAKFTTSNNSRKFD